MIYAGLAALIVISYLIGSISFAWIAGRLHGTDLRLHGSGNLGATTAARVLGGIWFPVIFSLDVLKGVAAVLLAQYGPGWLGQEIDGTMTQVLPVAAAVAVVLGHVYTIFHQLRGGKAVATSLGVLLSLVPATAGLSLALWLVVWCALWNLTHLRRSEAVGPASAAAAIGLPIIHILLTDEPWAADQRLVSGTIVLLAALVVWRHRDNLRRMMRPPATDCAAK